MDIGLSRQLKTAHLRLIHAIGECGQLNIAADQLAITQPAASRMLGDIEKIIGSPLFERHAKGMTPTPIGRALINRSNRLLLEFLDLSREVEELILGERGIASVGTLNGGALKYVIPAAQQLTETAPNADIHLTVDACEVLVEALIAGDHDFILARLPENQHLHLLDVTPVSSEHIKFICRSDHPLANAKQLSLKSLEDYQWSLHAHRAPIRSAIDKAFLEAGGVPPKNIISSSSLIAMVAMLLSSFAIAPLANDVADLLTGGDLGDKLTSLDIAETIQLPDYYLMQLKNRELSPIARTLKSLLIASINH